MKSPGITALFILLTSAVVCPQDTRKPSPNQPPSAQIDPGSIDFGNQVVKTSSKARRITVTNSGDTKLYINSLVITEDEQQDFTISNDTCTGKEIEAKRSCVLDIVFRPSATDRRKTKLRLTSNATESPQTIPLTGVGINSVAVPPKGGEEVKR